MESPNLAFANSFDQFSRLRRSLAQKRSTFGSEGGILDPSADPSCAFGHCSFSRHPETLIHAGNRRPDHESQGERSIVVVKRRPTSAGYVGVGDKYRPGDKASQKN